MSGGGGINDGRLRLSWRPFSFVLPKALVNAQGAVSERCGWLLRLEDGEGRVGWGEAAPLTLTPNSRALPCVVTAAALADLGPIRSRHELETVLPALPVALGFALGSAVLEELLDRLRPPDRLRLDANGGWDRATANRGVDRLEGEPRLEWSEQPLPPEDGEGLWALAARLPVALDESLRADPSLYHRWPGWQVRRPAIEGDPRPLLAQLTAGVPWLMVSTALETGVGRRWIHHLAALQAEGPTPTAPGLAPGWTPQGPLFDADPERVWEAVA
ncbi:MAG: o-succinylbenzoate synthase [Cyanobacteria bacterium]|nr:o-succinylbenzoate synthase [Cyanobacteriota bacterium]